MSRPLSAEQLAGLRILVIGLGRFGGGVGVTKWLSQLGAAVTVTDQAEEASLLESIDALGGCEVTFHLGRHELSDLTGADLVVVNPAVDKRKSPLFRSLIEQRIQWTTELNLFCERCPATVVGVTGTYGKSTTCAMLAHVLGTACDAGRGRFARTFLGGNIGRSLLNELSNMSQSDVVILEMSNAQLEDLPHIAFAPAVAVVTNLSPHHMDRYETYEQYVRAKLNIVGPPEQTSSVIVGALDGQAQEILLQTIVDVNRRLMTVNEPMPPIELSIPGLHNQTNAACAMTVCQALGMEAAEARAALKSFRGLPHRIEFVRTIEAVDYFNDSKSTSPAATITALTALNRPIVAIVGGQRSDVPLQACAVALARACTTVICTGESGPMIAEALRNQSSERTQLLVIDAIGLPEAVAAARHHARPNGAVLFSPGAPSFDAYANFQIRGRHFVDLVNAHTS